MELSRNRAQNGGAIKLCYTRRLMASTMTHLECARCRKRQPHDRLQNLCACPERVGACGGPLLARYDMAAARQSLTLARPDRIGASLRARRANLWRYAEVLPPCEPVTLGEGWTPLIEQPCLRERLDVKQLWVKDESFNPTGTFKARGLSVAVSMAKQLGAKSLALPSAGNAGGALAAYAARAGLEASVVMPADTPEANIVECRGFGARVILLDGLISDCGKYVAEHKEKEGWFDVSTLKEPYRVEGKKTMAYELFEQLGALPDVIVYPTGGGVGLIGMWKAFEEMEELGWTTPERPRMVSVQAAGCAPIVKAFEQHAESSEFWENAATLAAGLRVPKAFADWLILQTLYASSGTAVAVTDEEILRACREIAEAEGIFPAPEGAACWPALEKLRQNGWLQATDRVVWFNTGSGYKYLEAWTKAAM